MHELVFGFNLIAVAITVDGDMGSMYILSGWSWSSSQSEIWNILEQVGTFWLVDSPICEKYELNYSDATYLLLIGVLFIVNIEG